MGRGVETPCSRKPENKGTDQVKLERSSSGEVCCRKYLLTHPLVSLRKTLQFLIVLGFCLYW